MRPAPGCALLLAALLAFPPPAGGQGAAAAQHYVVVTGIEAAEDVVNLTVTTYAQPGLIETAGLYANDTLVSNFTGGVYLTYGTTAGLSFRRLTTHDRVELRLAYAYYRGNLTVERQTIPLTLPGAADVRPLDAWLAEDGNVTVVLRNFGTFAARDVLVSLLDVDGAGVGTPYYRAVADLPAGAEATAEFTLLDSTERPVVAVEVRGVRRTHSVVLRSADGGTAAALLGVELTTEFPALEASPGGTATYTLTLRNRGAERLVALGVTGLPEAFTAAFIIEGRRVQTVQLDAGATRIVQLNVGVPSSGAGGGAPLELEAWVAAAGNATAPLARVALTLTVTGAERLELSGRNWFASSAAGQLVEAALTVKNTGTAAAFDVALAAEAPSGWDVAFDPERIARLGPGEAVEVLLRGTSPATTAEGRYVLDVTAQSPSSAARERSFSVEVAPPDPPSPLPWLLGAGVAMAGALALVVFLRRR